MGVKKAVFLSFSIACAVLLSQFPAFYQQYQQRLGGALDEVTRQLEALDDRAAKVDLDRYDYIRRFLANEDAVVRQEGAGMQALLSRHVRLRDARQQLRSVPPLLEVPTLLIYWDSRLIGGTAASFRPALPLTLRGAVYTLGGFVLGYLFLLLLTTLVPHRVLASEPD